MKKLFYDLTEALIVSKCPSCGAIVRRSGMLCPECLEKYDEEKSRQCMFCKLPASLCVCSTRDLYYCRQLGKTMHSPVFYGAGNEVFGKILSALKYSSDRGSEKFFARELSHDIMMLFLTNKEFPEDWCVTYPPRRRSAAYYYGIDQAKGLAKRIARYTGMKFEKVFVRRGGRAQKTLGSVERKENAVHSLRLGDKADVYGKKYVIVDDVVTSGATMKACQSLLLSHGAAASFVLSVSKTPMRGAGYDKKLRFRRKKGDVWFKQ